MSLKCQRDLVQSSSQEIVGLKEEGVEAVQQADCEGKLGDGWMYV